MKSKAIRILQLLNPEEMKNLGRWLRSPWCNSNKKLKHLFDLLQPHYPEFISPKTSKESLFKKLYPAKEYDAKWMRNLLSALSLEVERFLQHEHLERDSVLQKKLLLLEFQKRHQTEWFQKLSYQLIQQLENKTGKDWEELFLLSVLQEQLHRQPSLLQRQLAGDNPLKRADEWLDQCYTLSKSRFLTELSERNNIVEEKNILAPKIAALHQLSADLSLPALKAYHSFLTKEKENSPAQFHQLKTSVFDCFEQVSRKDKSILLLLLLNEAARLHLQGEAKIYETIFELYQTGLQHHLLLHQDRMTEATFTNLVTMANLMEAYDFAKNFIAEYAQKLAPALRDDAHTWGQVYTAYNAGEPTIQTLEVALAQRGSDNTTFSIRSRILLLQMYFDAFLKDQEQDSSFFLDYSYSFEKQLQRNKNFPPKNKAAIKKSIQYTRKLYHLMTSVQTDSSLLKKIELAIADESILHAKGWLQQKVKQVGLKR